jgi:hypothetical protein
MVFVLMGIGILKFSATGWLGCGLTLQNIPKSAGTILRRDA